MARDVTNDFITSKPYKLTKAKPFFDFEPHKGTRAPYAGDRKNRRSSKKMWDLGDLV